MFKVSLLPESYRKYRQGKATKDIVSKVALLIMVCLFIVYGGFVVKNILAKRQLAKVNRANDKLVAQFPALEQYQAIYDNLKQNESVYQSIKPQGVSATEFITKFINDLPSNVHVEEITLNDWFVNGSCTVKCVTNTYEDVFNCKNEFIEKDYVSDAQVSDITKDYYSDDTQIVKFTLALATNGTVGDEESQGVSEQASTTQSSGDATTSASTTAASTTADSTQTTAATTESTTAPAQTTDGTTETTTAAEG